MLTVVLYWGSRSYEFVWDDQAYNLTANQHLMDDDVGYFWRQPHVDFFIPVSYSIWIGLKQLSDRAGTPDVLRPEIFHTANILVHAANAVMVMCLAALLFESSWAAFFAALMFAAHPVQVESVAWVSELRGLLAASFSLAASILYLRHRSAQVSLGLLTSIGALLVLAMLSKPSAMMMPFVLIVLGTLRSHDYRLTRARVTHLLVWLTATAPFAIITKFVQGDSEMGLVVSPWWRPFVMADAFNLHLLKILIPFPLAVSYGRTPSVALSSWTTYVLWLIPIGLAVVAWRLRRRNPEPLAALTIALLCLLPVSGLVLFKGQVYSTVADRYLYFPMIGLALASAWLLSRMSRRPLALTLGAALCAAWVALNIAQQRTWANELALFGHAIQWYPDQARMRNNYGVALQASGSHDTAILQFNAALASWPQYADAFCNRGISLAQRGELAKALDDQTRALVIDATDAGCRYNRAVTLFRLGNSATALQDAEEAERLGFQLPTGFKEAIRHRLQGR